MAQPGPGLPQTLNMEWDYSPVVESAPSVHEVLDSTPTTTKNKQAKKQKQNLVTIKKNTRRNLELNALSNNLRLMLNCSSCIFPIFLTLIKVSVQLHRIQ